MTSESYEKLCVLLLKERRAFEESLGRSMGRYGLIMDELEITFVTWNWIRISFTISIVGRDSSKRSFMFVPSSAMKSKAVVRTQVGSPHFVMGPDCEPKDLSRAIRRDVAYSYLGYRAERLAVRYFEKIAKTYPHIISVRLATPEEDAKHIDVIVRARFPGFPETDVPIQIKSGEREQRYHRADEEKAKVPSILMPKKVAFDRLCPGMKGILRAFVCRGQAMHI